ncbi:MAG: metal ABC transporter ATP-binding protein [Thermofilum sp.]|nr:metal ABC transporter ATP-binding protein [Thermofilum sp.]
MVVSVHERRPSLRVEDLTFAYAGGEYVLEGENLEVEGAGLVTVLGPNGAGKTTFFKLILGLLKPLRGRVYLNGEDVTGDPARAGVHANFVPQLSAVRKDLPATGVEVVEWALRGYSGEERRRRALEILRSVGAEGFAGKRLSSMSGGQLQRVLIARALARDTPILVLDEPFSGVDPRGREELVELLSKLAESRMVLVSTHDPVLTLKRSRLVVVFNRGIRAVGTPDEVYELEMLRKAYGPGVLVIEKCLHVIG